MVMVRKLIKHELFNTVRIAMIPAIVMVLLAILARIMFATSGTTLAIIMVVFYLFFMMATLFIGFWFGIYSFYQSLFTSTGYLTLSLPVTPDQLIWSKLLSAIIVEFASAIICILSACIFFIGLPVDILDAIGSAFSLIGDAISYFAAAEPLFFVELVIMGILFIPLSFLVFYAVMCIGQLFTSKNRKGMAIGLYIALMFVWNILSTTVFSGINDAMIEISIHLYMWVRIVFFAAVDVGCYFLVRYIIKNKVNLLA
ncbi:MAG: hypothetical protein K2N23_01940 [Clostridia bacterium]|nr:hypothetical protein [Clostridia bacterium]